MLTSPPVSASSTASTPSHQPLTRHDPFRPVCIAGDQVKTQLDQRQKHGSNTEQTAPPEATDSFSTGNTETKWQPPSEPATGTSLKSRLWRWTKLLGLGALALTGTFKLGQQALHSTTGQEISECLQYDDVSPIACLAPLEEKAQPWLQEHTGLQNIFAPEKKPAEKLITAITRWVKKTGGSPSLATQQLKGDNPKNDMRRILKLSEFMEKNRAPEDIKNTNHFFKRLIGQYSILHHPDKKGHLPRAKRERQATEYRDCLETLKDRYTEFQQNEPRPLHQRSFTAYNHYY